MAVTRWIFTDSVLSTTYTFAINPNTEGSPERKKNIGYASTTAPDGTLVVYEGREQGRTSTFSGTLLTQEQYEAFDTWYTKAYPISYTDDLGRTFEIIITGFKPTRKSSRNLPWRHDYTVDYLVLSEALP